MARILITSGPTRQYLDPVRYLTNASSGQMGAALAGAALQLGHDVTVVSGPVAIEYPAACDVYSVITTEEMLEICQELFPRMDGVIGVAAPCDYRPERIAEQKISKTGEPLILHLVETPDVIASLGNHKTDDQWAVGFALETNDQRFRALAKMQHKCCDLMIVNGPEAMDAPTNRVEMLNPAGDVLEVLSGSKPSVAHALMRSIQYHLIEPRNRAPENSAEPSG